MPRLDAEPGHVELLDGDLGQLPHAHDGAHLTVGASGQANNPLTVTLTNDASMGMTTPAACASTYFSMPSITGVTATGGAATSTTTPATDSWTS